MSKHEIHWVYLINQNNQIDKRHRKKSMKSENLSFFLRSYFIFIFKSVYNSITIAIRALRLLETAPREQFSFDVFRLSVMLSHLM